MRRIGVLMPAIASDDESQTASGRSCRAYAIGLDHRPQRADRNPLGPKNQPKFADMRRNWSRSRLT